MRLVATALGVAMGWLVARPAPAQGLIHQLPPDRTSVRFHVAVTQKSADGQSSNLAAEVLVSSVGVTKTPEGNERWIEIALRLPGQTQLLKLAIPEKHFGKGDDPFAHIARGWLKRGDAEPEKVEPERARRAVAVFLVPHFEKLLGEKTETLDTKLGKLECNVRDGKATATFDTATLESTGRFWLTSKVPLGWAQLELHRRTTRDGELVRESTSRFTIAEVRDDATSELPEHK
jgi:hypothetical protein